MSTTLVWFIVAVIFAAAIAFFAGRYTAPGSTRVRELEQQRDDSSRELRRYREQVNGHFETTAQLFNDVTASYRNLYEHLADGSERLGGGPDSPLLSTPPEQRQLEERLDESAGKGAPAGDTGTPEDEKPPEATSATEADSSESTGSDDEVKTTTGPRMSLHDMQEKPAADAESTSDQKDAESDPTKR